MRRLFPLVFAAWLLIAPAVGQNPPPALRVSDNGRFLEDATGKPFFWMGDTAWNLFCRLDRAEALRYLDHRSAQGFNVVQAHLLSWRPPMRNAYGEPAFRDSTLRQPNEAYWQHVDFIVREATRRGLYLALLPVWGATLVEPETAPFHTDTLAAHRYARFLGSRYRAFPNLIWLLGGDKRPTRHAVYDALARGLTETYADGHPERILLTFHPPGGTHRPPATSSGEFYHDRPWLDLNLIQSGHARENRSYERIAEDYRRTPPKPTLDSEPCYEQHPVKHDYRNGAFSAWDARRRGYWSVLAGACGYTYGGNGVWQMDKPGQVLKTSHFKDYWDMALDYEGARQMTHLRRFFEKMEFARLVPDSTLLASPPGSVDDRVQVARDEAGRWVLAYLTSGGPVAFDARRMPARPVAVAWFNPRIGVLGAFKPVASRGELRLNAPESGSGNDWIAVVKTKGTPISGK